MLNPGPGFSPMTLSTTPYAFEIFDDEYATFSTSWFGVDGYGADTIGEGGVSFGDPAEIDGPTWIIGTQVEENAIGNYLCLDSTWHPPGGSWLWVRGDGLGSIVPRWGGPYCFLIEKCCQGLRGDVTGDGNFYVDDLVFLVDYIFKGGPPSDCVKASDVTLDGNVLIDDLVYMVNYIFPPHEPPPPPCD